MRDVRFTLLCVQVYGLELLLTLHAPLITWLSPSLTATRLFIEATPTGCPRVLPSLIPYLHLRRYGMRGDRTLGSRDTGEWKLRRRVHTLRPRSRVFFCNFQFLDSLRCQWQCPTPVCFITKKLLLFRVQRLTACGLCTQRASSSKRQHLTAPALSTWPSPRGTRRPWS